MITIVYASRAMQTMDEFALGELIRTSRTRNEAERVTGMLVYARGSFLQQIEGDERPVDAIFGSIRRDPRHGDLRLFSRREVTHRRYGGWAMGFEHPHPEELGARLPGYRPSLHAPLVNSRLIDDTELAETLLELCATGGAMRRR